MELEDEISINVDTIIDIDYNNIERDIKSHPYFIKIITENIMLKKQIDALKMELQILKRKTDDENNHGFWYEDKQKHNTYNVNNVNVKYTITEKNTDNDKILDDIQIKEIYTKYKIPFLLQADDNNNQDNDNDDNDDDEEDYDSLSSSVSTSSSDEESEQTIENKENIDIKENEIKFVYMDLTTNSISEFGTKYTSANDYEHYQEERIDSHDKDEDNEVVEQIINDKKYYVTTGKTSKIYEIESDESAGKCLGTIINNIPHFNNDF
jgi:hypothetical protein